MREFINTIRSWLAQRSSTSALTTKESSSAPQPEFVWASPSDWTNWQSTADTGSMTVTINAESTNALTGEQAQAMGIALASAQLKVIEAAYGSSVASCYAQGFGCAGRDYMTHNLGPRETYNRFAEIADEAMRQGLPQGK